MEDKMQEKKSEMLALAEAMNNLAAALRESQQTLQALQHASAQQSEGKQLQDAVYELAQRVAVLSARLR